MIEPPRIIASSPVPAAVIRLAIPRAAIGEVMGPAIGELMSTVGSQGIPPAGPLFSHYLRQDLEVFDCEVGVPVASPVRPAGRVVAGELPGATVARTVYRGPYDGLGLAWGELGEWIKDNRLTPAHNL